MYTLYKFIKEIMEQIYSVYYLTEANYYQFITKAVNGFQNVN